MRAKDILLTIGKVIAGGVALYVGELLGGAVAGLTGLAVPELPAGADPAALMAYMAIGDLVLAAILGLLSSWLAGGFVARWLILAALTWVALGVNTVLEASIFSTFSAASPFTVIMYLVYSLIGGAVVAWLFRPAAQGGNFVTRARAFFAGRSAGGWIWRLLAALLAFPVIYLLFGSMVGPIVVQYYRQSGTGLVLPGMQQIIPMALLRSLLFLLACLPVLIAWQGSRLGLWLALGGALFLLVGGVPLFQAYWFPTTLRVTHSLEILADSFAHAGVLVLLLVRKPIP
jgi:hypothetical protein